MGGRRTNVVVKVTSKRIIVGTASLIAAGLVGHWLNHPSKPEIIAGSGRTFASAPTDANRAGPVAAVADKGAATNAIIADSSPDRRVAMIRPEGAGEPWAVSKYSFGNRWDQPDAPEAFARFSAWVKRFQSAQSDVERHALEAEGKALAEERKAAMRQVIKTDPQLALDLSIPYSVRAGLPESVTGLLETNVSERGALAVFGALAEPGRENEVTPVWRTATLGGADYQAYVYGRRLGEPTRRDIPLNGIALGSIVALSENPVRVLDASEAAARTGATGSGSTTREEAVCAISGQADTIRNTPVAAEVGGRIFRLCGLGHADDLNARLVEADSGSPGAGGSDPAVQGSTYTEGVKRLLIIRVDFPDLPGEPLSAAAGATLISGLDTFYREMSYNVAGFSLSGSGSDVTPTLRMTNASSYYGTNDYYARLQNEARAAATAAGYDVTNYDFDLTCFGSVPGWSWAGLAWVGAKGVWLRNYFTPGVAGHELGHNFGLNHANYWDTGGRSVIGTNGTSIEYGDVFDTMGYASGGANHFNARYKSYLNWLPTNAVQTATTSGVYRIQPHDNPAATGIRALKVVRNANTNFWVEFRQQMTGNTWMMNGAGIRWAGNGNQRSDLLDMTPGSANGKNDSPLVVGRTFSDPASGIHITTLRKAGTTPESLDVAVNLGTFPGNHAPVASIGASATSVAANAVVSFSATASDADGDTLAYYWDFGDGSFGTNGATASKSWSGAADYRVQCTVTDMKGGTATDSILVTVGAPTTYRISGTVLAGGGPVTGARVYVSSTRMAYTDSDGSYTIVGLPAGTYTVAASLDPYTLSAQGFANPVVVGPNASGIDFSDGTVVTGPPSILSQPQGRTVSAGSNVTLSATASGTAPLRFQWWKNGVIVPGATTNVLAFAPIGPADAGSYFVVVTNTFGSVTSSLATLVVNCSYTLSAASASYSGFGGAGTVQLSAHSDCAWSITGVPSWITLDSVSSGSGDATVQYTVATNANGSSRSATLTIAGKSYAVSQSVIDLALPGVTISAPADGFTTTSASVQLQGTASDNVALSRVEFRRGAGAYSPASGSTSWSASLALSAGTNVVSVRAVDTSGNVSPVVQRTYVRVAPGTLTLRINGHGSVRGATDGQQLAIGQACTLTAVPDAGYTFSNWTGSFVQTSPTLSFVMYTNLQVTANFVPNPFAATKGVFNGLFYETNALHADHAGFFTFTLTDKGSYSASLQTRGLKLPLKGLLDLAGRATNQVTSSLGDAYAIVWALALDGSDQIAGSVSSGSWTALLLGDRQVFLSKTNPAPQVGRYTSLVLGDSASLETPGGDGYGLLAVDPRGTVRLSGYLPDNTRFVAKSFLSRQGHWPLYMSLYGRHGVILGWINFREDTVSDLDGTVSWTRPATPGAAAYSAGFSSEQTLLGSRFTPPASAQPVVDWSDAIVRLAGGGLADSFTNHVTASSVTQLRDSGTNACLVKITPSSGLFSGSVKRPDTGASVPFRGAILQKTGIGSGYFIGPTNSGQVRVE